MDTNAYAQGPCHIVVMISHPILFQSVHAPRLFPDRGFQYDLLCSERLHIGLQPSNPNVF